MTMSAQPLSAAQVDEIMARQPDVFRRPFHKRFAAPLAAAAVTAYCIYAFWFFSIGQVFANGNWNIAGTYLADWVSYEVRPDIEYRNGEIEVTFPRFSPLGENPDPDWIETEQGTVTVIVDRPMDNSASAAPASGSFMSPNSDATLTAEDNALGSDVPATPADEGFSFMSPNSDATFTADDNALGGAAPEAEDAVVTETRQGIARALVTIYERGTIDVTPDRVIVTRYDGSLEVLIDRANEQVLPQGPLPEWASQREPGAKVFVDFGFYGRAEIRHREVKVNRRFLGWENFVFDPASPYWGLSFGEVMGKAFGPPIEGGRSNFGIMWENIVYNAEWQHGDVWIKLLQTIVMAFVGTLFAVFIAFPLSFAAARNITPNRFVNQILKRFFDFLRSVDMLIWALFFTRAFGPGPLAGISAIFFTDTGTLGKLYSEALENIDDKQREGVRSVGADPAAVQRFGVVPQVLPIFASQALYFWESNTRSATIIGAVGAGGIGLKLWEAMRTNQDWENVFYMVILILIVVFIFDNVSGALRARLVGRQAG